MRKNIPPFLLVLWSCFSVMVIAVGIGFAGGIKRALFVPFVFGYLAVLIWAVAWIIILAPFVLILARLVRRLVR